MQRDSTQKEVFNADKTVIFCSLSQMEQSNYPKEISSGNIHFNPEQPRPRRRTKKFSRKIRRIFFNPLQGSSINGGEARNNIRSTPGNFIYRNHVEPRVKLFVPREASFCIPEVAGKYGRLLER